MKMSNRTNSIVFTAGLMIVASHLMGATSCSEQPQRELKRRVQLGKVTAPAIPLKTDQGNFDFQYAANMQMWTVLEKAQAFTNAAIDPEKTYDLNGLDQDLEQSFRQCEEPEALQTTVNTKINGLYRKVTWSKNAACMINMPQAVVRGGITNFQLYSGGEAKFDILAGILTMVEFKFDSYVMSASMRAESPLIPGLTWAATSQNSYKNNLKVGAGLNFGTFGVGMSAYFNSNMASVVEEGLLSSVGELKTIWDTKEKWYGMIIRNCDKYVYIRGGGAADANVMEGDILRLENVNYEWEGAVCNSRLKSSVSDGLTLGYAKVVKVGDTVSVAEIIENDPAYPRDPRGVMYPGSRAYLHKLFVPTTKTAAAQ